MPQGLDRMKAPFALCVLASLATSALADTAPSRLDQVLQRGSGQGWAMDGDV